MKYLQTISPPDLLCNFNNTIRLNLYDTFYRNRFTALKQSNNIYTNLSTIFNNIEDHLF